MWLRTSARVSWKSLSLGFLSPTPFPSSRLLAYPAASTLICPISSRRGVQWLFLLQGLTFIKIKTRLFPANADGIYTLKYLSSLRVKLKGLKKWKTMFCSQAFSPWITMSYEKDKGLTEAKPFSILSGTAGIWQNLFQQHLLLFLIKEHRTITSNLYDRIALEAISLSFVKWYISKSRDFFPICKIPYIIFS